MRRWVILAAGWLLLVMPMAVQAADPALPVIREAPKPADARPERRARVQPTIPDSYAEIPFVETAPEPVLTAAEKARGYVLFQRPIMEPVYPNTRPLPYERLESLSAFATPGEFEPLTFSVYPLRNLTGLRVVASALEGPDGATLPASDLTVRLVTYWNVGFPSYTSRSTYRRLPELLERVTVHDAPALECQRFWITAHVPVGAPPGIYRGMVTLLYDGYDRAVEIPVALRVLEFSLRSDPAKHYSAYYYARNGVQYKGRDEAFIQAASANEYKSMVDYGIDMLPTFTLRIDDNCEKLTLSNPDELDRMMAAGMTGPVPVTADSAIARIYRNTTPGGERGEHWKLSKMPSDAFYEKVTALFAAFDAERKEKGWPEIVCCPIDEVDSSSAEFGWSVYKAVKAAGIRTYATKNPVAADAAPYCPWIDVWCSQPYSVGYDKIVSQDRYEYWSYPNHNAGEIKDRVVMCKGGRMTYGFGFWRSGYTTLIPWHWAWTPEPDQFDYLRGSRSGCGNRIGDDGEVIPAVYWECFREGRDDARYVYTLQQAAWERQGSDNADCRRLVTEAENLLQRTWDAINVQQKYLADGMWASEEFNARRWLLATATERLLKYPALQDGHAPSVFVADTSPKLQEADALAFTKALQAGDAEALDLGGDFSAWYSGTSEGTVEATPDAGRDGGTGLRWRITVDHKTDGESGGQYPVGWPRIWREFAKGGLDMSSYDYIEFLVRIDSSRDEVADDSTPLGIVISSRATGRRLLETSVELGDRQGIWIPVRFAIADLVRNARLGAGPWKDISQMRLFVSERDYRDGTRLTVDVGEARLLAFKSPVVARVTAAGIVTLPCPRLPVTFDIMGEKSVTKDSHKVRVSAANELGEVVARAEQDLSAGPMVMLPASGLGPGRYSLRVEIWTADGGVCSESACDLQCVSGPLVAAERIRPL